LPKLKHNKWKFAVDTGGTFTDIIGLDPDSRFHTLKILSDSPAYEDACIEGIRQILNIGPNDPLPEDSIEAIRFGTTVATNALLERKGGRVALFVTAGFSDLLEIGYQARPDIFKLCIKKPSQLYSSVYEVNERINSRGTVIKKLDRQKLIHDIEKLKTENVNSISVVLMHSWKNSEHELLCNDLFVEHGISKNIVLSHQAMNAIKIVSRGQSTVIDAYLSPVIAKYLERIKKWTGNIPLEFIQSSGMLVTTESFKGKNSLFSGPAGGVIAIGKISEDTGRGGTIGFDMGGTSTDVSRYDGDFERIYEQVIDGIELQTEMLNIITVASGGGSILSFDGQKMRVGPESAGAHPGPACYGFGGPLTITDANLLTGRIISEYFPKTFGQDRRSPLDMKIVGKKFHDLSEDIEDSLQKRLTPEDTARGFLRIANEKMATAIKEISVSKGFDVRDYALVCFGGAGGQHACALASILGITKIIFHPLGSLLSAYGIGLSQLADKSSQTVLRPHNEKTHGELIDIFAHLEQELFARRKNGNIQCSVKREVDLRPSGTDSFITVPFDAYEKTIASFKKGYQSLFGFYPDSAGIEIVNIRLEISDQGMFFPEYSEVISDERKTLQPVCNKTLYYAEGPVNAPVYLREALPARTEIKGPAYIVDRNSTLIVDPGFTAELRESGMIIMEMANHRNKEKIRTEKDPVLLEVFNNIFSGIAKEMGFTLRNTAYSVNIKERLDFSCALFDRHGNLVSNAPHIPVHIGSMTDAVKGIIEDYQDNMSPGDVFVSNNPYKGGSHLPDITVICPFFSDEGTIIFFTAARGHHADIGGITPGSLPPYIEHINEEGILIDSFLLLRNGHFRDAEIRNILTHHPHPARNIHERILDLKAQIASCRRGIKELKGVIKRYGLETVLSYMDFIRENASFSIKQALSRFLQQNMTFKSSFEDLLDDGSPIKATVQIIRGDNPPETMQAVIDFTGTGPQHTTDNLNAPLAVTRSAILYVLRCLAHIDLPLNSGCLKPIKIIVPDGSLLNPSYPAPVASGNVETSQRIVDVLLGALKVSAASQGTMNNLIFQVEGDFPYYETIAGGSGALDGCPGASGVQVHMTNTRITDPEILEYRHPDIRIEKFTLRRGSGGKGSFPGGNGVIREITYLKPATVSIISERRNYEPYGMNGGKNGKRGVNLLKKANGEIISLPHRVVLKVDTGDSIIIETPGGGGFGAP
jgi:5-oxoprolinase (ATP-hydrolysing)